MPIAVRVSIVALPMSGNRNVFDSGHASGQEPEVVAFHVVFLRKAQSGVHSSDDSHISLHLLDHRIQPAAQHLLGETEGEPLDGVER